MGELTREQIENYRKLLYHKMGGEFPGITSLCDMALRALSAPAPQQDSATDDKNYERDAMTICETMFENSIADGLREKMEVIHD